MEWSALDWNELAIGFYNKLGAKEETGRKYFEFTFEDLVSLSNKK